MMTARKIDLYFIFEFRDYELSRSVQCAFWSQNFPKLYM